MNTKRKESMNNNKKVNKSPIMMTIINPVQKISSTPL